MATVNDTLVLAFLSGIDLVHGKARVENKILYSYKSILAYYDNDMVVINEDTGNFSSTSKRLMNRLTAELEECKKSYRLDKSNDCIVKQPMVTKKPLDTNITTSYPVTESIDDVFEELKSLTTSKEDIKQNDFVLEVFEVLFGDGAVPAFKDGKRHFTYDEALSQLKEMNDVFTEHLLNEEKGDNDKKNCNNR